MLEVLELNGSANKEVREAPRDKRVVGWGVGQVGFQGFHCPLIALDIECFWNG